MDHVRLSTYVALATVVLLPVAACTTPAYSPNTYAGNAVQLANRVEAGAIVGYREVRITANGTVGAVAGGAAGGLLGSEYGNSAFAALGGSTVGAMVGNTLEHVTSDTTGWEYIIRKNNSDMLSVTQREKQPLALGQKVLVIMGPQARVVPDYSMAEEQPPAAPAPTGRAETAKREAPVKVEVVLTLPPGVSAQAAAAQTIAQPPPPEGVVVPVTIQPVAAHEAALPPEHVIAQPMEQGAAVPAAEPATESNAP